ncbi:MAG: pantetheine-phosphate adenylyltransferase [Eubacteriales bacterium]|nr:pantetheine-phosphate adenylyltransferase [Eubacteriales bacterium]
MIFVCAGSFDPVTNGHIDIIERASILCDKLIVVVLKNSVKIPTFTLDDRLDLLRRVLGHLPNVEIDHYAGLLVDYMKLKKARVIVKGLRAVSDYEYEMQMAHINKTQYPEVETLFMTASINYSYLSSSFVKELARNGGNIDFFVPSIIKDLILGKLKDTGGN